MVHGEVAGLKNGEPLMAGARVFEGDHRDKMADRLLRSCR